MDEFDRPGRSLLEGLFRLVGLVILVVLGIWLALRVVAGIVGFFVWMATTAVIVAVVLGALYLVFRGSTREP